MSKIALKIIIEKIITDEKARKTLFYIIAIPIVALILLISSIQYMFTMPYEMLTEYFSTDITDAENIIETYGIGEGFIRDSNAELINLDYTKFDPINKEAFEKLMNEAKKYIGFPYVWGGSSPSTSFDCSGYICWVYTKSGVYNLSRTTAQGIYNQTVPIPKEEAKAGDLIFFHSTYESVGEVSHIGIYLDDGKMLHAGDPIGFADINTTYWRKHFYGFGRLIFPETEGAESYANANISQ